MRVFKSKEEAEEEGFKECPVCMKPSSIKEIVGSSIFDNYKASDSVTEIVKAQEDKFNNKAINKSGVKVK